MSTLRIPQKSPFSLLTPTSKCCKLHPSNEYLPQEQSSILTFTKLLLHPLAHPQTGHVTTLQRPSIQLLVANLNRMRQRPRQNSRHIFPRSAIPSRKPCSTSMHHLQYVNKPINLQHKKDPENSNKLILLQSVAALTPLYRTTLLKRNPMTIPNIGYSSDHDLEACQHSMSALASSRDHSDVVRRRVLQDLMKKVFHDHEERKPNPSPISPFFIKPRGLC